MQLFEQLELKYFLENEFSSRKVIITSGAGHIYSNNRCHLETKAILKIHSKLRQKLTNYDNSILKKLQQYSNNIIKSKSRLLNPFFNRILLFLIRERQITITTLPCPLYQIGSITTDRIKNQHVTFSSKEISNLISGRGKGRV